MSQSFIRNPAIGQHGAEKDATERQEGVDALSVQGVSCLAFGKSIHEGIKMIFNCGDKVTVKGKTGVHVVHWPLHLPIPTINKKFEFCLVETLAYKLLDEKKQFCYAWETDLKKVEKAGKKK